MESFTTYAIVDDLMILFHFFFIEYIFFSFKYLVKILVPEMLNFNLKLNEKGWVEQKYKIKYISNLILMCTVAHDLFHKN